MKEDAEIQDCGLNPVAVMISWYFVPFLFVLIHEEVLKTRFTSHLPDGLGLAFEIIYAPLLLPF